MNVNKNDVAYTTIPFTIDDTNIFNYTYQGTNTGAQIGYYDLFMSTIYTTFIPAPDTLNVTDTYDFFVTATLTYIASGTLATAGSATFKLIPNTANTTFQTIQSGFTLSGTNSPGTHNTTPEKLYCYTKSPYDYGTSYTNILNCNNIKMLSTGIISKETINTEELSTYKSYLTIPDCGVYMYNGGQIYPIYKSTPSFVNFLNCDPSGGSVDAAQGVGGTGGTGSYNKLDIADIDDRYIVHPGYGVIIYDTLNYDGTEFLNYENLTTNINFLGPTSPNRGASARIYYNGVEITSY
jgi:hypothetical protein